MEITIKVEKGAIPNEDFFTKISGVIAGHAWYLDNGESRVIGDIEISRSYTGIGIKQINMEEIDEDN